MTAMSDYLEGQFIDHVFRTATFSKPTVLAIALCTAAPTDSDTGSTITEVANSFAYARETLNPLDANWAAPTAGDGLTSNLSDITFGPASGGNWGTITHVAICDSATHNAGNLLFHGSLDSSATVNNGDTFVFSTNDLSITFN
jgi:hypothetical protein